MAQMSRSCSKTTPAEPQTPAAASTPLDSQLPAKKISKQTQATDGGEEPQAEKKVPLILLFFFM
jgi:hypothetical protein